MTDAAGPEFSGVERLLERIRDEGVGTARREAERLLAQAQEEAAALRARARREATAMLDEARAKIELEQQAGKEALHLAARDTLLELRSTVREGFETFVQRLVTRETCDLDFLRDFVLVIAGRAAEDYLRDKRIEVQLGEELLRAGSADPLPSTELGHALSCRTLELSAELLREGIELIPTPGIGGGARVRLRDENLELDLSDEAISRLLLRFLLPRFRYIIEGEAAR